MEIEYCSLNSQNSNEPVFATASYFTKLLLVEYNAPWPENPLTNNLLPTEVNDYLLHFKKASKANRVLFIKNKEKAALQINIFAINNLRDLPYTNHFILNAYKELLNFSEADLFTQQPENKFTGAIYLVCTNGKRDKCCSKFGVPIFKQLSQLSPQVWECTHVGGDRFAPNVVALPYGIFYGALGMQDLPTIVGLTEERKIFLNKYRGRSCYSLIEQAAEYYLRRELNNLNIFDHELMSCKEMSPAYFEVEFRDIGTGVLMLIRIKRGKAAVKKRLTCNSVKEEFPVIYQLVEA